MNKVKLGTIKEGFKANLITEGFEYKYEIVELTDDEPIINTYDTLQEFAEKILVITQPMGYFRLKGISKQLLADLIRINEEEAISYCKDFIGMDDEELDFLEQ